MLFMQTLSSLSLTEASIALVKNNWAKNSGRVGVKFYHEISFLKVQTIKLHSYKLIAQIKSQVIQGKY